MSGEAIIAVDIGNARVKLGWFDRAAGKGLPEPRRMLQLAGDEPALDELGAWLWEKGDSPRPTYGRCPPERPEGCFAQMGTVPFFPAGARCAWWIGSVNRPACTRLVDWLRDHRPHEPVTLLGVGDLALAVEVPWPELVGIDRLLDAVAANRLRAPDRPAVVVDMGTGITVDLVSADGAFRGGAILPGMGIAARALHEFTDVLPLVDLAELGAPPPALGTATVPAMQSGLFWGTVGAIRQLIEELSRGLDPAPEVFVTGGASPMVAPLLRHDARYVPHLTLAGIALAAWQSG